MESETRQWCNRIPRELILDSIQSFYQDLHSRTTSPTDHCALCQQMTAPDDLHHGTWQELLPMESAGRALVEASGALKCRECFPVSSIANVPFCNSCYKALVVGRVPRACAVNNLVICMQNPGRTRPPLPLIGSGAPRRVVDQGAQEDQRCEPSEPPEQM